MDKDQEKPFKTIEVIDSRTNQLCKVACMSCIRGHRTTSCGILICRSKVFWTVKRPGRPSNSCTCRFGPGGRCRCVVAKTACPHKPKRGEKRSVGCRCDEQGRFCCLLEPEHWEELCAQRKPRVAFYSSREALEASQMQPPAPTVFSSIAASTSTLPQRLTSLPTAPAQAQYHLPGTAVPNDGHGGDRGSSVFRTRFGMMGVGAPMGEEGHQSANVLDWRGETPLAPRDYHPYGSNAHMYYQSQLLHVESDDAATGASHHSLSSEVRTAENYPSLPDFASIDASTGTASRTTPLSAFDFDKMNAEYFSFQLPSAICQSCGMSGCTCKQCPATMQSFGTGSWANCCSKGHTEAPPAQRSTTESSCCGSRMKPQLLVQQQPTESQRMVESTQDDEQESCGCCNGDPDSDYLDLAKTLDTAEPMDLSEFLVDDPEHATHPSLLADNEVGRGGCCCGDP